MEASLPGDFDVSHVGEMDAPHGTEFPDYRRKIVPRMRPQGSRADAQTVVRAVGELQDPVEGRFVPDDPGKAEDGPGRIVRVEGHFYARFFRRGDDLFKKISQVLPESFLAEVPVGIEQASQFCGVIGRAPARKPLRPVGKVHRQNLGVVVGEGVGTVGQGKGHVGAGPVEDGHEVVAQHGNACLSHIPDGAPVLVDKGVPVGAPELDVLVNGDALNGGEDKTFFLHRRPEVPQFLQGPGLALGNIVQCADDPPDNGDLPDFVNGDGVAFPVPSERHYHGSMTFLTLLSILRRNPLIFYLLNSRLGSHVDRAGM